MAAMRMQGFIGQAPAQAGQRLRWRLVEVCLQGERGFLEAGGRASEVTDSYGRPDALPPYPRCS